MKPDYIARRKATIARSQARRFRAKAVALIAAGAPLSVAIRLARRGA